MNAEIIRIILIEYLLILKPLSIKLNIDIYICIIITAVQHVIKLSTLLLSINSEYS